MLENTYEKSLKVFRDFGSLFLGHSLCEKKQVWALTLLMNSSHEHPSEGTGT